MYYSERMVKTVIKYQFEYHKVYLEAHPELARIRNGITTVPVGYVIHHKDLDRENNDLDNLQLMTDKEHKELHGLTHRGKGGYQWLEPTQEMIDDMINGVRRKEFCEKYQVSKRLWNKIKDKYLTDEQRLLVPTTNVGRKVSDETKLKHSIAGKGKKRSQEAIDATANANRGRKNTEEAKQRMSVAAKNRCYQ